MYIINICFYFYAGHTAAEASEVSDLAIVLFDKVHDKFVR